MNRDQIMVKMVLDRWNGLIKNFDTTLNALTDDQLQNEISPGKNRGIYLLGHLAAVHDDILPLLDFGNKLFPELNHPFIESADRSVIEIPSASALRASWRKVNETLAKKFDSLQAEEWFQRHTNVSAEDFIKEPHRNKLNVIISRISHLAWHVGQFVLLQQVVVES